MAEKFFGISRTRQSKALDAASLASGKAFHILEKDCWVVWAIRELFTPNLGEHLVFKGGTSLSKGYGIIERFSEDIDLTYDIRALIPDLVGDDRDALPPSRNQRETRWVPEIGIRLEKWIIGSVIPAFTKAVRRDRLSAKLCIAGDKFFNKILIDYAPLKPLTDSSVYVGPPVILEFGATSTGDPSEQRNIVCYAAGHQGPEPPLDYPDVEARILRAARTFWEKATAAHVYCLQQRVRGKRLFRHWYDLVHLDGSGYVEEGLRDKELAMSVARQKAMFFRENDAERSEIDYVAAVRGGLVLVPEGKALDALRKDYKDMKKAQMFPEQLDEFDNIMTKCREIETKVNQHAN